MIADRVNREAADCPNRKGAERDGAERAPAVRVKRSLRQTRRHKAFDIDMLPVGVIARPIESL